MQYKFLIYISYSYAIPIGTPLENEILKRNYTVKWFGDQPDGKSSIANKTNALHTVEDVIDYSPHIVLAISDSVPDFFNALKVQVFHGFHAEKRPDKNNSFAHFRLRGFFDLYCTQGPNTTEKFKLLSEKYHYFEVIETGWSKVDPLFPIKEIKVTEIPTIMIASTFTPRLSLAYNDEVYNKIKRLSTNGEYNFIMVLHPKIPKEIVDKWKSLDGKYFTFFDTTNLIPLFQKASVLLADTTSAIQEFLLQRKPVVTINHTFSHKYLIDVKQPKAIEESLIKALSYPEELLIHIDNYINKLHPYTDGKSSNRVIDASISYLHKDKSHLKSKPLNLIRKYKLRKKLNYFTLKSYNKPFTITKT